jgi:hypothetical protein
MLTNCKGEPTVWNIYLNRKTYTSTDAQKKLMDLNPLFRSEATSVEISGRDKIVLQTIYGEIVKNLEIARVTLNQETPVIQVVDSPYLPLKKDKKSKLLYFFGSSFFCFFMILAFLVVKIYFGKKLNFEKKYFKQNINNI